MGDELTGPARDAAVLARIASFGPARLRHVAGGDFGLNNVLTVAFGGGQPGLVVSNQRLEARLAHLDAKLDKAIAAATTPEHKALQSSKDTGTRLSHAEMVRLRQLQAAVHATPAVQRLRTLRANFIKDLVHRLSCGTVARLRAAGTQVLVLGHNRGWKDGVDKGRAFNRRLHGTAHSLLLAQLKYKCAEAGILVVATEESYTSKTSFALNEPLRSKDDKAQDAAARAVPEGSENSETRTEPSAAARPLQGRRRRHDFTSPGAPKGWGRIHADLNGAYNILRKVFLRFGWREHLSRSYELLWLSPKAGLSPNAALNGRNDFEGKVAFPGGLSALRHL